jgi:hypothetical protein
VWSELIWLKTPTVVGLLWSCDKLRGFIKAVGGGAECGGGSFEQTAVLLAFQTGFHSLAFLIYLASKLLSTEYLTKWCESDQISLDKIWKAYSAYTDFPESDMSDIT